MKCFVISPIKQESSPERRHADETFKFIIEPALAKFGIAAVRSDQMSDPGRISDQMYRAIFEYDLCIAILTFANPNVYYELAVAQSASRPLVVLIDKGENLPFDVKDFRTIEYDLSITSYESRIYIDRLAAALEQLKDRGWRGEDVFRQYRQRAQPVGVIDPSPFEVRIESPADGSSVGIEAVEGTFKALPEGFELRTLRYYPEQHGFIPHGRVACDLQRKTWRVNKFDVGGVSGETRGIEIALAGADARILLDYWEAAHGVHKMTMAALPASEHKGKWLPPIARWPSDLLTCHRVLVKKP